MSSSQLPTPGRLILENITLLAGSPTAFQTRYGLSLTPTTFSKPGNTASANAVLHFLISTIDADIADSIFKPCFPILDRDQERDFRKVVDQRLAVLERTKLLPSGCARKSVVASAGGDRFLDLLWSLSSLALQQACLRHPAYGSVSRIRLLSQPQSDTSSQLSAAHHPASRSSRSLFSARSSRTERHTADALRPRRFLGVGMLSASQQRQKDAEEMRARIDSERIALNRTTEMGQNGAKTWASEADSLRGRIAEFEAKLKRLKTQLTDMGFDENGVDIRARAMQLGVSIPGHLNSSVEVDTSSGPLRPSSSGETLAEELKTSPIESTESCSSVGDTAEACNDLAADLSRLLTFTAESQEMRREVEDAIKLEKPALPDENEGGEESDVDPVTRREAKQEPENILSLVRVATNELEQVTSRMHEIREAREKAGSDVAEDTDTDREADEARDETPIDSQTNVPEKSETSVAKESEIERDLEVAEKKHTDETAAQVSVEEQGGEPTDFPIVDAGESTETAKPEAVPTKPDDEASSESTSRGHLTDKVARVLEEHNVVVENARQLQKDAAAFSAKSAPPPSSDEEKEASSVPSQDTSVETVSRPQWYTNAVTHSSRSKKANTAGTKGTKRHGKPPRGNTSTFAEMSAATKALQGYSHAPLSSASRRRKGGSRSLDSINLDLASVEKRSLSTAGSEADALCSPSESNGSLKGTPRSVRFAELPPSYSASRTSENSREGSPVRNARVSDEKFVESVSKALQGRNGNKDSETRSRAELIKERLRTAGNPGDREKEGLRDEGKSLSSTRKTSRSGRTSGSLRNENQVAKNENGRQVAVSSQKPPRVHRNRSAHRAARSKGSVQRSFTSRHQSSVVSTQGEKSFSSRSASADSIRSTRKAESKEAGGKVDEYDSLEGLGSTGVKEKSTPREPQRVEQERPVVENEPHHIDEETGPSQESDEELVENRGTEISETVQKKLFMTPDSAVSSKPARHLSRLARRTSTGVLHSINQDTASPTGTVSKHCDVTAVVKDSSDEFPSTDEDELLFSPQAKPALSERSMYRKTSSGGFFAGQTAEWQESVRARSTLGGRSNARGTGRENSDSSPRGGRNSGRSSSGVRSRVQALRARLAALK